jgi:hypothetical protein
MINFGQTLINSASEETAMFRFIVRVIVEQLVTRILAAVIGAIL